MAEYWQRYRRLLTAALVLVVLAVVTVLTGLPGSHAIAGGLLAGMIICLAQIRHDLASRANNSRTKHPDE